MHLEILESKDFASRTVSVPWWFQIGDKTYHHKAHVEEAPISHYAFAVGSATGLSPELSERLVDENGKYLLFYMPEGVKESFSELASKERRSAVSSLVQVNHAMVRSHRFNAYSSTNLKSYQNPLADSQDVEQKVVDKVHEDRLREVLTQVTNIGNGNRVSRAYDDPLASRAAVDYLTEKLNSMGESYFAVCEHSYGSGSGTNVIAYVAGSEADSAVIGGAHYDSRPFSSENEAAPGAIDNGSGSAGLLVIAEAFASAQIRPRRPIYFVWFGSEEPGLLGSKAFEEAFSSGTLPGKCQGQSQGSEVNVRVLRASEQMQLAPDVSVAQFGSKDSKAIIMDEVAWRTTNNVDYPKLTVNLEAFNSNADIMDHLFQASMTYNGPNFLDIIHNPQPFGSDHMSFPHAVLLIHGDDEKYPFYHKSDDKIENANFPLLSAISKMNAAALLRLALLSTSTGR